MPQFVFDTDMLGVFQTNTHLRRIAVPCWTGNDVRELLLPHGLTSGSARIDRPDRCHIASSWRADSAQ
jgi:hypothetical protein